MPAPLSTVLLVIGVTLAFTVTPWASAPLFTVAVLNELARMLILAGQSAAPAAEPTPEDQF